MIGLARSRKRMLLPTTSDWTALPNSSQAQSEGDKSFRGYAEEGGKVYYAIDQFSPCVDGNRRRSKHVFDL